MPSFYGYIHHKNIACYKLVSYNGYFRASKYETSSWHTAFFQIKVFSRFHFVLFSNL